MKAILYLCRKSLELRQKQQEKIEKAEVENVESNVVYDEEDQEAEGIDLPDDEEESDWDLSDDEEVDESLYDTKLDQIDEVLMVQENLNALQTSAP